MITFWQYIKEIHDSEIAKISKTLDDSRKGKYEFDAEHIFRGKKRISFPITNNTHAPVQDFIDKLKSHGIDITIEQLKAGKIPVKKEVKPEFVRPGQKDTYNDYVISTYITKILREKNKENLRNEILDELSVIQGIINKIDYNTNYSVIVSRDPIDMLRMGDHVDDDNNQMKSCHSFGRNQYCYALRETRIGSIIAYAVKSEDLKKIDLQANEIFRDKDRGVIGTIRDLDPEQKGIYPVERLRFRRFYHEKKKITIFIPEFDTYTLKDEKENPILIVPGFRDAVVKWAKNSQKDVIAKIDPQNDYDDFNLRGASYQDSEANDIWNDFFGTNVQGGKIPLNHYEDINSVKLFNNKVERIFSNLHINHVQIYYYDIDIYTYVESLIDVNVKNFIKIPIEEEFDEELDSLLISLKSNNLLLDLSEINIKIDYLIKNNNEFIININIIGPDTEFEKDIQKYYDFVELNKKISNNYDYLTHIVYSWFYQNGYINYNIQSYDEFKKNQSLNYKLKNLIQDNKSNFNNIELILNKINAYYYVYLQIIIDFDLNDFVKIPTKEELLQESPNSFLNSLKSELNLSKLNCEIEIKNNSYILIKLIGPDTEHENDINEFKKFIEDNIEINENYNIILNSIYYWFYKNNYIKKDIQNFLENKKLNHFQIQEISEYEFYNSYLFVINSRQNKINFKLDYFKVHSEWFEVGNLLNIDLNIINEIFEKFKDEYYFKINSFIPPNIKEIINLIEFKFISKTINNNAFNEQDKLYGKFNLLLQNPYFNIKSQLQIIKLIETIDQNFEKYVKIIKDWWQSLKKR